MNATRSSHNRGKGAGYKFLLDHVSYQGDDCVIWPFTRTRGYAYVGVNGKIRIAHRFMCELAHGAPPTPKHHAAHSCGRGDEGCVNPRHLSWKTVSENMLDRRKHGTHGRGPRQKLNYDRVLEIRAFGPEWTDQAIADQYGVTRGLINQIRIGRIWKPVSQKRPNPPHLSIGLTDDQIREIRRLRTIKTRQQTADQFGITLRAVDGIRRGQYYPDVD
jgi:hypothetical protein